MLKNRLTGTLAAIAAFLALGGSTPDVTPKVASQDFLIPSGTPGIELFVRNKHAVGLKHFKPERTVLYVHGASLASELVFDLPIGGTSWADSLARQGWDVWMVDIRGYGRSTWPEALRQPAEANPPVATTEEAVADFTAAADFIRSKRRLDRLQVIGWSWGSVIAGSFAAQRPDQVAALVLVTPLWVNDNPATQPPLPKTAWLEWTLANSRTRIQKGVPADQTDAILPPATVALWEQAVRDSQPESAGKSPELFRSPTGVMADPSWRGEASYDPGRITAPTLIIRGAWDELTPRAMSQGLFARLTAAPVRTLTEIPRASHFVIAETGRDTLFAEVQAFLARRP